MGEVVMNYYRMGDFTPEHLWECRHLLEPLFAKTAAVRRTDDELRALKRSIESFEKALKEGQVHPTAALEFHYLIADSCHNPLISHMMKALATVFERLLDRFPLTTEDAWEELDLNKRLYKCLQQRDGDGASRLMITHFESLKKHTGTAEASEDESVQAGL